MFFEHIITAAAIQCRSIASGIPMRAHIFGATYKNLLLLLVEARKKSGITQIEMAAKLDIDQPRLSKVERAQGRMDVIQYFTYCRLVGIDPCKVFSEAEKLHINSEN